MTTLSVNINKIATLRNARGTDQPNLLNVTEHLLKLGVKSITVHPRPDERHITKKDVYELSKFINNYNKDTQTNDPIKFNPIEFNIEGYPSRQFLEMVLEVCPDQCTLVPDKPDAITSNAGWDFVKEIDALTSSCKLLKTKNIRSSLFLDVFKFDALQEASLKKINPDRAELYTEGYAKNNETIGTYLEAAKKIQALGIQINAGHDLNTKNLKQFVNNIPFTKEVSIGHALISESLFDGFTKVINQYHKILDY